MQAKSKKHKKNPLSKAQKKLLSVSLKNLLGTGLIENTNEKKTSEEKELVLKNAFNAFILNN